MSSTRRWLRTALVATAAAVVVVVGVACTDDTSGTSVSLEDPGDCTPVDVAVSSEKIELLTDLARTFNESDDADLGDGCAFVRVQKVASGAAATLVADDWPDPDRNGPQPVIWSPASSAWIGVVDARREASGRSEITGEATPFMNTPLVIAMPERMARALGYPETPLGFSDIVALSQDPQGWAAKGHPEWGAFKLGKTNPNFSTSGLHFTIAEYYAATGKTSDLTLEDLTNPSVVEYVRNVESGIVHYGDTTLTFLNNWYRNDQRGTALTYVSAVAVEEKSVIDYNQGNPDGILDPGERPSPPREKLVAIYPKEGTLFSDNPLILLDAPWVTEPARQGAERFVDFVSRPENQQRVLEFGFRPANPSVAIGAPIDAGNGLDPNQPQNVLGLPDAPVTAAVIEEWAEVRKPARVLMVIDVSGSMGDLADPDSGDTKLDLAQRAATDSLEDFKEFDDVGLRAFSTGLSTSEPSDYVDVVPIRPMAENRELLSSRIRDLIPRAGTPLYTVTLDSLVTMQANYDPVAINAVVLLTDGVNDDPRNDDFRGLIAELEDASDSESEQSVRIFTIGYGLDANASELRAISEATNAAFYSASDPTAIDTVFDAVVSNF